MIHIHRARLLTGTAAALLATSLAGGAVQAQEANLTVTASVVAACTLTGGTLAFDTYVSGQQVDKDGQTDISYDCAEGIDIAIALGSGGNPEGDGSRNMASGSNELRYQLYQGESRNQVWGTAADSLQVFPTLGGEQQVPVYGRIFADQAVPAGEYQDTVIITLTVNG